jgi:hypothetical protein
VEDAEEVSLEYIINKIKKVAREEQQKLWLPIDKHPPPFYEDVLFLIESKKAFGKYSQVIFIGYLDEDSAYKVAFMDFKELQDEGDVKVTHWMRNVLPKPSWEKE